MIYYSNLKRGGKMNKSLISIVALLLLSVMTVSALPPLLVVNGQVMETDGITPAGDGIEVTVECNLVEKTDTTDINSQYSVEFDGGDCWVGDTLTASVPGGDSGNGGEQTTVVQDDETVLGALILPPINLIIPEFSAIAASLAFAGAGASYLMLKRRN